MERIARHIPVSHLCARESWYVGERDWIEGIRGCSRNSGGTFGSPIRAIGFDPLRSVTVATRG